ncbi:hypothetical protein PIB30_074502 [Stylosanthes scabra]|uniref:FBD domain-containing protein n=1 Tax=Stylosanthes scabra TaxID=79078 RepID=A0ABU6VS81_9FABA|nr:hypothetical protein [Stylosanthes scabra]
MARAISRVDRISALPDAILVHITCRTLVVLKLTNITLVDRILTVSLPALKTLYMNEVGIANTVYLSMILSGCLNIHHLQITNLFLRLRFNPLVTFFRSLIHVNLSFYDCKWLVIVGLLNSCPLLQNLVISKSCSQVDQRPCGSYSTVHLPLLKTLHMDRVCFAKPECLDMILSGCPNIHHLEINDSELDPGFIPLAVTLNNLTHIKLYLYPCKWIWIAGLLNSCPFLQVLDVKVYKLAKQSLVVTDQPYPKTVPGCLSQLRACTLRKFYGDYVDIQFATYILQNARVLNKMSIQCKSTREGEKLRILKNISMVPRISPTCKVWLE